MRDEVPSFNGKDGEQEKGIPPSSRNDRGKWGDNPGGHSERSEEPLLPQGASAVRKLHPSGDKVIASVASNLKKSEKGPIRERFCLPMVMTRIEE